MVLGLSRGCALAVTPVFIFPALGFVYTAAAWTWRLRRSKVMKETFHGESENPRFTHKTDKNDIYIYVYVYIYIHVYIRIYIYIKHCSSFLTITFPKMVQASGERLC